jgi:hypothetical protein
MPGRRYCFGCILEWAQRDSRCPQCAKRFRTITHRQLVPGGKDAAGLVLEVLDIPERTQVRDQDAGFAVGSHKDQACCLRGRMRS